MKRDPIYRSTRDAPAIMTLEQTAVLLGITYECAKARAQNGQMPGAFRSGKSWRVDKEVLIESFGTRPKPPEPPTDAEELTAAVRALLSALGLARAN